MSVYKLSVTVSLPYYALFVYDSPQEVFFTLSFIFTSFREQDETYINSLRWSALVELEPTYTSM